MTPKSELKLFGIMKTKSFINFGVEVLKSKVNKITTPEMGAGALESE